MTVHSSFALVTPTSPLRGWVLRSALIAFLALALAPALSAQTVVGTITRAGLEPFDLAVYEAGNKLFVIDSSTDHVLVYDGASLTLLDELTLTGGTGYGMVVDEPHGKLYMRTGDNKLAVINAATNVVTGYIDVNAKYLPKDEGLGRVYGVVGNNTLVAIDVATDTYSSVTLSGAGLVSGLAVNPVTHEVFVSYLQGNSLDIIDGLSLTRVTVPGEDTWGLTVNWLENKVYGVLSNWAGPWVFDRDTNTGSAPGWYNDATNLYFNPTSNRVYSDVEVNKRSTIIEGASDSLFELPMKGSDPLGFRHSTNHVYYAGDQDFIGVLDDTTQLLEIIPIPDPVYYSIGLNSVAVNQTTGRVFVVVDCNGLHSIYVLQDTPMMTRPPVFVGSRGSPYYFMIDPVTNVVVDEASMGYGHFGHGFAVRPGGGRLFAGCFSDGYYGCESMSVFAGAESHASIASFGTGGENPNVPAVTPDGSRIYVSNSLTDNVGVISAADYSLITTVSVGDNPWGLAIHPNGTHVYVANQSDNTVSVISTASDSVVDTIPIGTAPWGVAINPSGTKVYVANSGSNSVSVIDTTSDSVMATVYVGTTPHWLAASPDGGRVYVTNRGAGTVSVIGTGNDTVIQTVPVGDNPEGVAVMPDGSEVYVVNFNATSASSLSVIDPSDYSVSTVTLPTDSVGAIPIAIADPTSKFAGRVTSPRGIVAGALVRALQEDVEKGTATTNAAGDYSIFNLLAGTYDIEVTTAGCSPLTLTGQSVAVGRTNVLNPAFTPLECPLPEVELSPRGLWFGTQGLATSSEVQFVTLTNAGGADLTISNLAKSGGNSSDFGFSHDCPTSPSTLGADGSCTINVTFTPSAKGPRKSSVVIASDAPGSPHRAMLTGVGTAVSVTPTSWDFGSRPVGSPSPPKVVTLTNLGGAPVHIWGAAISGLHAEDFQHSHNCPAPPTMLAGWASCTFNVIFNPAGMGTHTAPLTISHDGGGSPAAVSLTGIGTASGASDGVSEGTALRGQPSFGRAGPARRVGSPSSKARTARPRGRTATR
jgi:YVTN family beta-propeller protein